MGRSFDEPDDEDRRISLINELYLANESCDRWAAQVGGLQAEVARLQAESARLQARLNAAEAIIKVAQLFANEHGDEYNDHGLDGMCEEWLHGPR